MEAVAVIAFYRDLHFIFAICPCCGNIINLSEVNIKVRTKAVFFPKYKSLIELQDKIQRESDRTESINGRYQDRRDALDFKLEEFQDVEPLIIKKVRHEGRWQAIAKIKEVDKIFIRRKIDPRDVRLLFSPIDFVCFNGMTENKQVDGVTFLTRHPDNRIQEKVVKSIAALIQAGNVEFVLARIKDTGKVEYIR